MTYTPRHPSPRWQRVLALMSSERRNKPCQVIISLTAVRDDYLELVHRARTLAFCYDPQAKVTGWRS